jgi:hypothetical protein
VAAKGYEVTEPPASGDIPHDIGGLLKLTETVEKLTRLDVREFTHYHEHDAKLSMLGARLTEHRQMLAALDGFPDQVAELAAKVTAAETAQAEGGSAEGEGGKDDTDVPYWLPRPTFPWWETYDDPALTPEKRQAALDERTARLKTIIAWVDDIFRPGYGQIAAALPDCWPEHPILVHVLDTLTELWKYLYLSPKRGPGTLRDQAELQTRYLPAYAEQFRAEAKACEHGKDGNGGQAS